MSTVTFEQLGKVGRLGNQMLQVASTVGLARAHGLDPVFPEWDYRTVFEVPDEWFGSIDGARDVRELADPLEPWCRDYLLHLPFIEHAEDEVRSAFTLRPPAAGQLAHYGQDVGFWQLARPTLGVHVRRGDVLSNPAGTINVIAGGWYLHAIATARRTMNPASVAIFTDDEPWCRQLLERSGAHGAVAGLEQLIVAGTVRPTQQEGGYVETGPVDWLDMMLMTQCDAHVLSNATYGWWGAWLANNAPPSVWYPWPWFGRTMAQRHRPQRWWRTDWMRLQTAAPPPRRTR